MNYIKLVITVDDPYQEQLIAELEEMEFDGFQQLENELIAYIPKERFHIGDREKIERILGVYPGNSFIQSEEVVTDKNWNREWEQTIQPQTIGSFLVKPTWSAVQPGPEQILLEIDPKMAFGTGYHSTTRLILKFMPQLIKQGDAVLDAGTGTGILAIAAVKLDAEKVFAFDNDEWSINNARANFLLNNVSSAIEIRKGSIDVIEDHNRFDIILANINRNVILEMLPSFHSHLKEGGSMLLSGILQKNESSVAKRLKEVGLGIYKTIHEEEWIGIWVKKSELKN